MVLRENLGHFFKIAPNLRNIERQEFFLIIKKNLVCGLYILYITYWIWTKWSIDYKRQPFIL